QSTTLPFLLSTHPPPPASTLLPYTTLFRSAAVGATPTTVFPSAAHASVRVRRVTVLPLPAGASASCTRAPDVARCRTIPAWSGPDRKSTRLNSSHVKISYAVFCLKKKKKHT